MGASFKSFLGTGWSFPPEFDPELGAVKLVSDETDINQSLSILLSTSLGERVMQPRYGCNLNDYLFEPLSSNVIGFIKDLVTTSILFYEPRIITENVDILMDDANLFEGRFFITVTYKIPETNSRFNYVYDYYLNEALKPI